MGTTLPRSVVFITGTFLGNNCWDEWKLYFESKGYNCIAPPWPHKEAPPEELRGRHPDPAIASNRLADLTDHFATIVNALPEKPIFIGHSLGGLIVQLLLQRGLGAAGVAIHSFPPLGIGKWRLSFLRAWWGAMGFFTSPRTSYMMSFKKWKYAVVNGISCEQQKELYYKYAIPESKLIVRDSFKYGAMIDFSDPHVPLLFISGGRDRIIPASLNYNNYKKYSRRDSITEYKDFRNHNHLAFGQPAWMKDADFVLYWLQGLK